MSFKKMASEGFSEGKKQAEQSYLKKIKPINERQKVGRFLLTLIFMFCFFGMYASHLEVGTEPEAMLANFFSAIAIVGTWVSLFFYSITAPKKLGLRLGKKSWIFALAFGLAIMIDFALLGQILGTAPAGTIPLSILIVHIKAISYSKKNIAEPTT